MMISYIYYFPSLCILLQRLNHRLQRLFPKKDLSTIGIDLFRIIRFFNFKIYADSYAFSEDSLDKNGLGMRQEVSRKTKVIVCKRKCKDEKDYECVLRHIRNSLAHNNIYVDNTSNRKYILLEDYNTRKNLTSKMVLSQIILSNLKSEIMK